MLQTCQGTLDTKCPRKVPEDAPGHAMPWLQTPCKGAPAWTTQNVPVSCPLQLQLHPLPGHPYVEHPGTPHLAPTSASAVLPGHSLYREPWHPLGYTRFTFSYPSKVPSAQRVPGPPQPIPTSALAFPPGQFRHRVSQDPQPMTATDPASQPMRRWGRDSKISSKLRRYFETRKQSR